MREGKRRDASPLNLFIIFGAAVWSGGRPSRAMLRRTRAAYVAAMPYPRRLFFLSGGEGRHPPAEALVMRELLVAEGVAEAEVLLDTESRNTLATVLQSAAVVRSLADEPTVWVCTDGFHLPRCRWLLRLEGIRTRRCPIVSGRGETKPWRWRYFWARECAAIVWDTLLLLAMKLKGKRTAGYA